MQSDKYVYMGPVRYDRPDYSAMSMRELGATKALEHPLMARQFEVAQTVRTVQAVPDAQLGPGAMSTPNMLQSIIQRPNEHVYTWTPTDSSDPLPLWLVRAITEAVDTPDLRVMRDPGDPTRGRLYRRAVGDRFLWEEPVSWVPVPDLRIAYGGSSRETVPGVDSWMADWLSEAGRTISAGMTFLCTDGMWRGEYSERHRNWVLTEVDADGNAVSRANGEGSIGEVVDTVDVSNPTTYTVYTGMPRAEAKARAMEAGRILRDWAKGDVKSQRVVGFMLGSMFMRDHPEQCYVLQGPGGTGKSTLAKDLVAHLGRQAMTLSFDLLAQPTAMSTENAMIELSGHLLALTDDYDPRGGRFQKILPPLKTLLTGLLPFSARRRGEDALVDSAPQAVHVITTNYHLPIDDSEAEQRRFMFASLLEGGVFKERYMPFRDEYGFWPFTMFGMLTWCWYSGDHSKCRGVSFVDQNSLSDRDVAVVRAVLEQGYVVSTPETRGIHWAALGLRRTSRREDGKVCNVYLPVEEDNDLWGTWVQTATAVRNIPDSGPGLTDVDAFAPVESDPNAWAREKLAGGETGMYVPAGGGESGKVAVDWQRKVRDGRATELPDFGESPVAAQVAGDGEIVVDWDACHDGSGAMHGLNRMESDLDARMGSTAFPTPFLERSARGGFHGAYGVPDWLVGYFKKAAVGAKVSGDPTLLVDLRAPMGGYVVAVGSTIPAGTYDAVARPEDGRRPDLTQPMLEWFESHGYLAKPLPSSYRGLDGRTHHGAAPSTRPAPGHDGFGPSPAPAHDGFGPKPVDMSPIPEGQRNQVLHDWMYGRAANHPENWDQIRSDALERGLKSGLKADEIHVITGSVARALGLEA